MMKSWSAGNTVAVALTLLALTAIGCQRDTANQKRYELRGTVMAVEKDKHLLTVDHEDIKDFMEGMTMSFTVRDNWVFDKAEPGDRIAAMLVVNGTESWLEEVVITKSSGQPSSAGSSVTTEAKTGDPVPDFALVNQSNRPVQISQYRGKVLLLTFVYTRCPVPDYCTLMSNNFAEIDRELQKQPELYKKTHLLTVSIEPEYDTPSVLRSYGASHTGRYEDEKFEHWEFATGTKDQVKQVAQFFGLQYYPQKDQIIHGLRTAIISADSKVVKVYHGNEWKPAEVIETLQKLIAGSS